MIPWYVLPVPIITACLNRYWRGEGNAPRWLWYLFMTTLASYITIGVAMSPITLPCWLVFFLGYALAPWQAMFSAITGLPPSRRDHWLFQWMQDLAHWINFGLPSVPNDAFWRRFGIIYGTIRALLMVPGVELLCWAYGSGLPLTGLLGLLMGFVYYLGYRVARHFSDPNIAVAISEVTMGWWLGTYILIVGSLPSIL